MDNLKRRLNIYGLSDILVRKQKDLSGNLFLLIEVAGANEDEVKNLIAGQGKFEAKNIFNQVREKALRDINAKKEVLDKQIDDEIRKAEQEIKSLRDGSPDKTNKIAIETSSELIQKLIGA